mmetsp:Transcript_72955/g.188184  ORF Transcript_72955/g.188184 Transcript_72955/m.188184 type:complete len:203 (-) Transcript_72955:82-690(-)
MLWQPSSSEGKLRRNLHQAALAIVHVGQDSEASVAGDPVLGAADAASLLHTDDHLACLPVRDIGGRCLKLRTRLRDAHILFAKERHILPQDTDDRTLCCVSRVLNDAHHNAAHVAPQQRSPQVGQFARGDHLNLLLHRATQQHQRLRSLRVRHRRQQLLVCIGAVYRACCFAVRNTPGEAYAELCASLRHLPTVAGLDRGAN